MTPHGSDPAATAALLLPLPPARIGVATSGGPDSLAALVLVARVCVPRGVPVVALHVDHGLRPGAAAPERELVERAAREAGATVVVRRVEVAEVRARDGGSVEFVARELRHRALDAMAVEQSLTHVVFAHHREDQIETVLLAILRGAWPGALAGIPASRQMPGGAILLRPFLATPRAALRAHSAGLSPAEDPMNLDRRHRRVAVREDLLPALRAASPAIDETILAIAEQARAVHAAASEAATGLVARAYREPGVLVAPAAAVAAAGWFARASFLRRICEDDPALGHATFSLLEMLGRACAGCAAAAVEARRGVWLTARGGAVALYTDPAPVSLQLSWTGDPVSAALDAVRRVRIERLTGDPPPPAPNVLRVALDRDARIEIRQRHPGDRFQLGQACHKLLADELSDRKVQPVWRDRIPLVFVDGLLRWIPGLRVVAIPDDRPPNAVVTLDGPMPWALPAPGQ